MTAGSIPPRWNQLVLASGSRADLSQLSEGEVVNAQVTEDLGEGRYAVRLGDAGARVVVESSVQLEPNQTLSLRVVDASGPVVLQIASEQPAGGKAAPAPPPPGSPGAGGATGSEAAGAPADQVTLPSPFAVRLRVSEVAAHVPAQPAESSVPVGLAVQGAEVAVHFPDGAVMQGTPVVLPYADVLQAAPGAAGPTVPADAGAALAAAPVPVDLPESMGEAALLVEEVQVRVRLSAAGRGEGARQPAVLHLAMSDARAVLEVLASRTGGAPLEAALVRAEAGGEAVNLDLAGRRVRVSLPSGAAFPAGDAVEVVPAAEAALTGGLRVSVEAARASEGLVDAALRAAGLTPSPLSREAGEALLAEGQAIQRESIQALLALAAGREGAERAALLRAGAHLLAQDLPVSPPLAAGARSIAAAPLHAAELLSTLQEHVQAARAELATDSPALAHLAQAERALAETVVRLGEADTPEQLARFMQSLGRETLDQLAGALESAGRAVLAQNPALGRLDAAIQALQAALRAGGEGAEAAPGRSGEGAAPAAAAPPADASLPAQSPAHAGGPATPEQMLAALTDARGDPWAGQSSARPAHPGVNPAGTAPSAAAPTMSASPDALSQAAREILQAENPEQAAEAVRRAVESQDQAALRTLSAELERAERDALARDPVVQRLGDALDALREVGRRFLVYKAENLSSLRQDPSVFVAEMPFRLGEEEGSGRVQLFYRRRQQREGRRWSARVVLDLQTTRLGPVVGDLRFYKQDLSLSLFSANRELSDFLARDRKDLIGGLQDKGFHASARFLVIPDAEPVRTTPSRDGALPPRAEGRLDVEA